MAQKDSNPTVDTMAGTPAEDNPTSNQDSNVKARGQKNTPQRDNARGSVMAPGGSGATTEEKQPSGFLESVFKAIALVGAWLFVLGWSYLHMYY